LNEKLSRDGLDCSRPPPGVCSDEIDPSVLRACFENRDLQL
jgi:hypothetical protein